MFQELRVDEPEPARRTACTDEEETRKVRDIFGLVNVFDLRIADRAGTGDNPAHVSADPPDLFPRDLNGVGRNDHVSLVAESDYIAVDVLCDFF